MMDYLHTLEQVKAYVESLFRTGEKDKLFYHNLEHTEEVIGHAVEIANYYHLSDKDFFTLMAACWFHDVGYLQDSKDHEAMGADLAAIFLRSKDVPESQINEVRACIMATKMPQQPEGLLQQIICDADLYHLGAPEFKDRHKAIRKEAESKNGPIDKTKWREENIKFLREHRFHTDYAAKRLSKGKEENLATLLKKTEQTKDINRIDQQGDASTQEVKKEKSDRPDKGIETMFRITSNNHQRLSDMADNKAHIMISTNSIILSVILSILLRKLEDNTHLILPTILLLVTCVVAMVFSILATRPNIPSGIFTPDDLRSKRVNLLFFGNFYRMNLPDFDHGMRVLMDDRDFLYGSLIKDLHGQGVVLGRKYRLMRTAYNVFMYGIIVSVLSFILAMVIESL
jgi:predicted metal-dependent HD superfamily phosphohydrolase